MSKYKVGDKFVLEITSIREGTYIVNGEDYPYKMEKGDDTIFNYNERSLDKLEKIDITAEEARETALKISEMEDIDIKEFVLDGEAKYPLIAVFHNLTPQEAKAKIEAWEKTKEIRVGDVVQFIEDLDIKVLITRRCKDGFYNGIDGTGAIFSGMHEKNWKKTGQHYDIESILDQIGGAS